MNPKCCATAEIIPTEMTDNSTIQQKLKQIKQSFRLVMNGPAAQSMRERGVAYGLNWGVPIMELRRMEAQYGKDYDLAVALMKENVRECKLLATMIMPVERMHSDMAELWMEQTQTQELAEQAAFNLYQYMDEAPMLAFKWIASAEPLRQIAGYAILGRLLMNGRELNSRGINELIDQAHSALADGDAAVRHAAYNCMVRFADMGEVYSRLAHSALKEYGF